MTAMRLSVMNTINNDYLGRTSWSIHDASKNKEIKTTTVPFRNPSHPEFRWIALYFDKPLPADSGPYELEISDFADVILDELDKKKEDVLEFGSDRSIGTTDTIELVVVHKKTISLEVGLMAAHAHLSAETITSKQDKDHFRGTLPRDRYEVSGMRITQVPGANAGIKISLQT